MGNLVCEGKRKETEKDVLVLSTYNGEKTPMIITFKGKNFKEKLLNINLSKGTPEKLHFSMATPPKSIIHVRSSSTTNFIFSADQVLKIR